jgi:2-keto-4-pentenoate hydratase/2-oxohepta-3-ene-1,7-dioic acid hydratase in catechol pathway
MRFLRVGEPGQERPVVLTDDDGAFDLSIVTADIDGQFLADGGIARTRDAISAESLPRVDIDGQRVGPPLARPGAVICIGQNYAAHAAGSGNGPPEYAFFFFKHSNT